jgi:hypothetical protein
MFIFLTFLGCKKNDIGGTKLVNIHVETESHKAIDSVRFEIEKTVPVVFKIVSQGYSDSDGNCTLVFDYNTDNFATYGLKIEEIESGFTYSGNYNKHKIYKLKSKIPELDFGKSADFNLIVIANPASELQLYCDNNSGQPNDLIDLKIYEIDSLIFSNQIAVANFYDTLKIHTSAQKQVKVNYKTIKNGSESVDHTETLTLNDFETRTLKIENEK